MTSYTEDEVHLSPSTEPRMPFYSMWEEKRDIGMACIAIAFSLELITHIAHNMVGHLDPKVQITTMYPSLYIEDKKGLGLPTFE